MSVVGAVTGSSPNTGSTAGWISCEAHRAREDPGDHVRHLAVADGLLDEHVALGGRVRQRRR